MWMIKCVLIYVLCKKPLAFPPFLSDYTVPEKIFKNLVLPIIFDDL